jgi:hypothetical protein
VAPLETTVTPNSKDVREGGQEASPKRESGLLALAFVAPRPRLRYYRHLQLGPKH